MTGRIIKAHSTRGASQAEEFNFVDLRRHRDDLLSAARCEADEILQQAQSDAEAMRERTRNEAEASGRDEGLRDAADQVARQADELAQALISEQLLTALPALKSAAAALQSERDRWLIRWERTAVKLGVAIAEKLLQRQLAARPEFATGMITEALRLAAGQPQLAIYLNPDDLAAWGDRADQIVQSLTACGDTTLIPDSGTTRGGCRIETRHGEIDARVETMLHRIVDELIDG